MTYQITASPIRGQKIETNVEGVRELQATLSEYREAGYEIKKVKRVRQTVVKLSQEPQLA